MRKEEKEEGVKKFPFPKFKRSHFSKRKYFSLESENIHFFLGNKEKYGNFWLLEKEEEEFLLWKYFLAK